MTYNKEVLEIFKFNLAFILKAGMHQTATEKVFLSMDGKKKLLKCIKNLLSLILKMKTAKIFWRKF